MRIIDYKCQLPTMPLSDAWPITTTMGYLVRSGKSAFVQRQAMLEMGFRRRSRGPRRIRHHTHRPIVVDAKKLIRRPVPVRTVFAAKRNGRFLEVLLGIVPNWRRFCLSEPACTCLAMPLGSAQWPPSLPKVSKQKLRQKQPFILLRCCHLDKL